MQPEVSVLITSYNRKEYILEAVKSVLQQSVDRTLYEIIVVKNYKDNKIDCFLNEHDIKSHYLEEPDLPSFTLQGCRLARGKYLCFLDDDDLFLPDKLSTVINEFETDAKLIYFHNYFREVNGNGRKREAQLVKPGTRDVVIDTSKRKQNTKADLYKYYSFYNMSCISVRTSEFIQVMEEHTDFLSRPTDLYFYIASCLSHMNIKISTRELNLYRVHTNSETFGNRRKRVPYPNRLKTHSDQEELAKKYRKSFIKPIMQSVAVDSIAHTFLNYKESARPRLKEMMLFVYYSMKKRNRFMMALIVLLYLGILERSRIQEIISQRKVKRVSFS